MHLGHDAGEHSPPHVLTAPNSQHGSAGGIYYDHSWRTHSHPALSLTLDTSSPDLLDPAPAPLSAVDYPLPTQQTTSAGWYSSGPASADGYFSRPPADEPFTPSPSSASSDARWMASDLQPQQGHWQQQQGPPSTPPPLSGPFGYPTSYPSSPAPPNWFAPPDAHLPHAFPLPHAAGVVSGVGSPGSPFSEPYFVSDPCAVTPYTAQQPSQWFNAPPPSSALAHALVPSHTPSQPPQRKPTAPSRRDAEPAAVLPGIRKTVEGGKTFFSNAAGERWEKGGMPPVRTPSNAAAQGAGQEKRPVMACLFCRGRKIACGGPLAPGEDRTCNQCHRRGLKCTYPTESHRGLRRRRPEISAAVALAVDAELGSGGPPPEGGTLLCLDGPA